MACFRGFLPHGGKTHYISLAKLGPDPYFRGVHWQPNASSLTDTDAVTRALEAAWPRVLRVEAVRLPGGRAQKMRLGEGSIDRKTDNAPSVMEEVAAQCAADNDALGGEERTYEIQVWLIKNLRKPDLGEEMKILGRLKFGTPEAGDRATGGVMKEVAGIFKGYGEAQAQIASADEKRMGAINSGFEIMAKMMEGTAAIAEQTAAVGANHVKMFELKITDERERRQEAREEAQMNARAEAEERADMKRMAMLEKMGSAAEKILEKALPTILFKIQVDTACKAKEAGIKVESPDDSSQQQQTAQQKPAEQKRPAGAQPGDTIVVQLCPMSAELGQILDAAPENVREAIAEAAGDQIWDLFCAAMCKTEDNECRATLLAIQDYYKKLTKPKRQNLLMALAQLGAGPAMQLNALFQRIGLKFE